MIAPAVGLAWLVVLLVGAWRPNRGWIDRLGRAVGSLYLLLWLLLLITTRFTDLWNR